MTGDRCGDNWAAVVALGANLGDARQTILRAMERLADLSDYPLRRSSLWRSVPVDCPPGSSDFVNAVVAFRPRAGESPESLLDQLQALEREFGRERSGVRNEPRTLDLDLIAFGTLVVRSVRLTLPHPRAAERVFVLRPLAEIGPDYVLPGQIKTVAELLERAGEGGVAMRLVSG